MLGVAFEVAFEVAVDVVFDVAFDVAFDLPPCAAAGIFWFKMDQKEKLSEPQASFFLSHFGPKNPGVSAALGSPFFGYFFWRDKKSD
ncbi:hypothetical protein AAKU58_001341 [Oxalobacteraceae bacterium GrIS 1.18]